MTDTTSLTLPRRFVADLRPAARRLVGIAALLVAGCAGGDASLDDPAAQCQEALGLLDRCAAEYCDLHDDAVCTSLLAAGQGSIKGGGSCSLSSHEITRLRGQDCDDLVADVQALTAGKADFPCPAYFPWCNQLAPGNAGFLVNLLDFSRDQAQLEVIVPDVGRTRLRGGGETWTALRLQGAGTTAQVGAPAVPTVSFLLGVPDDVIAAEVEDFRIEEELSLGELRLYPRQQDHLEDAPAAPFDHDARVYALDEDYPGTPHALEPAGTWRNYRVVRVTVHPFQYNPFRQHLTVATRLRLELSFVHGQQPRDTVDAGEASLAGGYARSLVNYPEIAATAGPRDDDPGRSRYLFIVHDPLLEAVQPLVLLKQEQGFAPQVLELSKVGAEPTKIKDAILAAYQASAIEYVLLVGDVADLPSHTFPADPGNWQSDALPSDYWYGLLAGDDLLTELSVGRLSARTPAELSRQVARTLAHARGDRAAAWRSRILLLAHEQQAPGKYQACSEAVRTASYQNPSGYQFLKLYGGEGATNDQLRQALRQGVGIVAYRGHGSEQAWYEWNGGNFSPAEGGLGNGDLTPVVLSIACYNGALQHEQPSHAEQWLLAEDGGAVAFLGATKPSWTLPNDDFEKILFRTLLNEGVTAIGPLVDRSRVALLAQLGNSNLASDNVKMYLWLGDPSLEVAIPQREVPPTNVGWCNLQWPPTLTAQVGQPLEPIYGQVWAPNSTELIGPGLGVRGEVGYGPPHSDPTGEGWQWVPAVYNVDKGNNDEYQAVLTAPVYSGDFAYAVRFQGTGDTGWTYCDQDGSHNGLDLQAGLGTLSVHPPYE
ncbi:MAG: C25 family cysteine peptidase [Myxococcota bacterium]|nr:C25 family cysteine peptidase [Myxococcota bacterium]